MMNIGYRPIIVNVNVNVNSTFIYTVSQKTSLLWLAITLTHMNEF